MDRNGNRPAGDRAIWWSVIRQLSPGVRVRVTVAFPPPRFPNVEIPEHIAREIYEEKTS